MNQVQFAEAIGRSLGSIRNYESGHEIPVEIIDRLQTFALSIDRPDLAVTVSNQPWKIAVAEPAVPSAPPSSRRKYQREHDMLDKILDSKNKKAIQAVISNLVVFSDYVEDAVEPSMPQQLAKTKKAR